jgi:hypothetical protein
MPALTETANGTFVLHPWAMPASLDTEGEREPQGRYCVAYSSDGWWLIDAENFKVLRWCVDESDARASQVAVTALGHWFNGLILDDHAHNCEFCDASAIVYHDDMRHGLTMFTTPQARRVETCERHDRFFHDVAWDKSATVRER